jgi:hypothetical protein
VDAVTALWKRRAISGSEARVEVALRSKFAVVWVLSDAIAILCLNG